MKRILTYILLLCLAAAPAFSETRVDRAVMPHEIRAGWGDMLFETLMWHNPNAVINTMPAEWSKTYDEQFRYHQHLFLEYQYRFNYWLGIGGMVDVGEVGWDQVTRNGRGEELSRDQNHYFYNISIMPTIRFTYFRHEYLNLYSGLGIGVCINGGTETNVHGQHTEAGAAVNITALGMSVNYQRYFAAVEFGGLYGLRNANTIYMAGSRMFTASVGARF